jgi:hypothetical protein
LHALAFSITIVVGATTSSSGSGSATAVTVSGTAVTLPAASPTSAATPTLVPGTSATIGRADANQSITLPIGSRFLVNLGLPAMYVVTVNVDNPAVVAPAPNVQAPAGTQGIFAALAAGMAHLTITADPACRTAKPQCELPSLAFVVTIVVR